MKKIVKIEPYYEPRVWGGGRRLIDEFHYHTDVAPLGEVYCVVALPGHADCHVPEMDMTLSQLYASHPEWFNCETEELPIKVNIIDPVADLSIQLHPDDAFARAFNGGRGKPEAWVILDTVEGGKIEFGHYARNREEFIELAENRRWDQLLRYLPCRKDAFINIPCGNLHAIGKGVLTFNISRNAELTLRLYDYDRIDPLTGKKRQTHPQEVYENVNLPDRLIEFQDYPCAEEFGCRVTRYWDEPGLYTLIRLQVQEKGSFLHERFAFYVCVKGEGTINGVRIRQGDTFLVPDKAGWVDIQGGLDLFLCSYRNKEPEY